MEDTVEATVEMKDCTDRGHRAERSGMGVRSLIRVWSLKMVEVTEYSVTLYTL